MPSFDLIVIPSPLPGSFPLRHSDTAESFFIMKRLYALPQTESNEGHSFRPVTNNAFPLMLCVFFVEKKNEKRKLYCPKVGQETIFGDKIPIICSTLSRK